MQTGTLSLNKNAVAQLANELKYACRQIDSKDWLHILLRSTGRVSSDTAVSKYNQVRNLG